jgi:Fic family protein
MLFASPKIDQAELDVIRSIEKTRTELRFMLAEGRHKWTGLLARQFLARSIQGSNSVEGITFSVEDAIAAIGHEPAPDNTETQRALYGFQAAMTYILHLADDPHFTYHEGFIRGLHFMMTSHEAEKSSPGRWRPGPIFVHREETNQVVYEGPPPEMLPALMRELMDSLEEGKVSGVPSFVQGAMAHLNLVMIHPFRDGNGRMARALQTLVIVRERVLDPEFCSIEEYIGRRARQSYYDALGTVGGKTWNPHGDARPFVRFCLTAHYNQAERLQRHALRMRQIWRDTQALTQGMNLPERLAFAIGDVAFMVGTNNASYRNITGVDERRATRDLKLLVDNRLLIPLGEKRGRSYKGGPIVEEIRRRAREAYPPQPIVDPFS